MVTDQEIREALRQIVDPELGVNIVDLGLVRSVDVAAGVARIQMTMTSPACPLRDYLEDQVRAALDAYAPDVSTVDVVIVDEPPWSPDMMSDEARRQLGEDR